jgi:hypothetical protein
MVELPLPPFARLTDSVPSRHETQAVEREIFSGVRPAIMNDSNKNSRRVSAQSHPLGMGAWSTIASITLGSGGYAGCQFVLVAIPGLDCCEKQDGGKPWPFGPGWWPGFDLSFVDADFLNQFCCEELASTRWK